MKEAVFQLALAAPLLTTPMALLQSQRRRLRLLLLLFRMVALLAVQHLQHQIKIELRLGRAACCSQGANEN